MINLATNDTAIVRASGRIWLVTRQVFSPEIRRVFARQDPLRPRRLDGAADRACARRLYTRMVSTADIHRRSDAEVARWLERGIAKGALLALDITPDALVDPSILARRLPSAPPFPGGLPEGPALPLPPPDNQSSETRRERCAEMLHLAAGFMTVELRREFLDLLTPTTLDEAATALTLWTGSLEEGLRAAFDPQLFARAWSLSGWAAFDAVDALARCILDASAAMDAKDLEAPARSLATGIHHLGVAPFFMITAQLAEYAPEGAFGYEAAVRRWASYIDSLELPAASARGASLWGSLSPTGAFAALGVARQRRLATLSGVLTEAGFANRYNAEFQPGKETALTRRIWDLASRWYVAGLTGKVTLFVEQDPQAPAVGAARVQLAGLLSPTVTEVEIVDVTGAHPPLALPMAGLRP